MTNIRGSGGLLLIVASLLGCARHDPTTPPPKSDGPSETEPDAAAAMTDRDAAVGRDLGHTPSDAPGPSTGQDGASVPDVGRDSPSGDVPPLLSGAYLIERLEGEVTARELDTFIRTTAAASIPTSMWMQSNPKSRNILSAFGRGGWTLEALNLVYEIAKDAG